MIYATVAPFARLAVGADELTYTIAADQLAAVTVGRLVLVPLRGQRVHGVITALRRQRPGGVARLVGLTALTPISVPGELLALARSIRRRYWQPLGIVLSSLLPPPLLRWPFQPAVVASPERRPVPIRQTVALVGRPSDRTRQYHRLIERAVAAGRSALIEFAHRAQLDRFLSHSPSSIERWDSSQSRSARWQQWQRVAAADGPLVVAGLRSVVGAPVPRLGLIIVDTPNGRGQKDDQAPYSDARRVAELRSSTAAAHVVYGDDVPLVTTTPVPTQTLTSTLAPLTLLPSDPANGSLLQAASEEWLLAGQPTDQTFIFLNRLGVGSLRCRACGIVVRCPTCERLPTVIGARINCGHCGWRAPLPNRCQQCGNPVLTVQGTGTERIAARVATTIGRSVAVHDHHHPDAPSQAPLIVGTEFALPFLGDHPPDRVLILGLDLLRQRPTYDAGERTLRIVQQLRGLASSVAIETAEPTDPWFAAIKSGDVRPLIEAERADRQSAGYPPFVQLVRLASVRPGALDPLRALLERDPQLRRLLARTVTGPVVSGPVPRADRRGQQLIIRLPATLRTEQLLAPLQRAGALAHVTVDVDPSTESLV